jgi:hypothetical protein
VRDDVISVSALPNTGAGSAQVSASLLAVLATLFTGCLALAQGVRAYRRRAT